MQWLNGKYISLSLIGSYTHYTANCVLFITFTLLFNFIGPIFRVRPLKMGPIGCTETSVRNYHYSLRNSPEKRSSRH